MASLDKIFANRANAQHSSGPRTETGKAVSSRNAVKHNLTGRFSLLDHEDKISYAELGMRYVDDLQPVGILEEQLVEALHDAQWRLTRIRGMEEEILLNAGDDQMARLTQLSRYEAQCQRAFFRAMSELRAAQKVRRDRETEQAIAALEQAKQYTYDPEHHHQYLHRYRTGFVLSQSPAYANYYSLMRGLTVNATPQDPELDEETPPLAA